MKESDQIIKLKRIIEINQALHTGKRNVELESYSQLDYHLNDEEGTNENLKGLFDKIKLMMGLEFSENNSEFFDYIINKSEELGENYHFEHLKSQALEKEKNEIKNELVSTVKSNLRTVEMGRFNKSHKAISELENATIENNNFECVEHRQYTNPEQNRNFVSHYAINASDKDLTDFLKFKTSYLKHSASDLDSYYPKVNKGCVMGKNIPLFIFKGKVINLNFLTIEDIE